MLKGVTIEKSDLVPPGAWCLWVGNALVGVISKARREWLAKFGLNVDLPDNVTRILVDPDEFDRIIAQFSSTSEEAGR